MSRTASPGYCRANSTGATITGFTTVEVIDNPLGAVPVVNLRNSDRLLDEYGFSEIDDTIPLVDALNKSLADMMVASEFVGRPRRWATGIELTEQPVLDDGGNPVLDEHGEPVTTEVNPIPEGARAMISEAPEAKFGQLDATGLGGYEASVRVLLGQIMAVSTLPAHYVGVFTDNPASASPPGRRGEPDSPRRGSASHVWAGVGTGGPVDGRRTRRHRPGLCAVSRPMGRRGNAVGRRRSRRGGEALSGWSAAGVVCAGQAGLLRG